MLDKLRIAEASQSQGLAVSQSWLGVGKGKDLGSYCTPAAARVVRMSMARVFVRTLRNLHDATVLARIFCSYRI